MAVANDYVTGTITLTNGSTTFTGTGTAWRVAGFRDGDRIYVDNLVAVIAPNSVNDPLIDSNTSGKLTRPWTGTTGTRAYRMSYKPDGARVTAETRNLIELLGNGNLETIGALTPTTNAVIRGNVAGTAWEKFNVSAAGFSTLGVVVAANKAIYYTDANTAATYDLTAVGRTLMGATSVLAQLAALGLPEQLAANRTYYVRKGGSDGAGHTGLTDTDTDAFLTINKALNAIYNSTDSRTFSHSIIVRAGTYNEGITLTGTPANSGSRTVLRYPIFLIGDTSTPANVVIDGGGSHCVFLCGGARLDIHGFKLAPSNPNAYCLNTIDTGTQVNYGNLNFGATNVDHVTSTGGSVVLFDANYTISGGALNHWHATEGGMIKSTGSPITITLTGTPNFPGQFAGCADSDIFCPSITFVGSATGRRFLTHHGGIIRTGTDNKNYLPGNVPGIQMAGGQFDYPPSFSTHKNFVDQTGIPGGVDVWVTFPNGNVVAGSYDTTNSSWQPRGGKCMISAHVTFTAGCVDQNIMGIGVYKNGAPYKYAWAAQSGSGVQGIGIDIIDDCNGDDVYQIFARCDGAGTRTINGTPSYTWFTGSQL